MHERTRTRAWTWILPCLGLWACGSGVQMEEPGNLIRARPRPTEPEMHARSAEAEDAGGGYDGELARKVRRLRRHGVQVAARPSPWQGDWIAKATVPVRWDGSWKIAAGRADVEYEFAVSRTPCTGDDAAGAPTQLCESYRICAIRTPPFHTNDFWVQGPIHVRTGFKETLFNLSAPGPFIAAAEGASEITGWALGDRSSSPILGIMLGYQHDDLAFPWPKRAADMPGALDMDQDGHIGVSLYTDTRKPFEQPPVEKRLGAQRASSYHVASRILFRVKTRLLGMNEAEGSFEMPIVDGQVAIQARILGCITGEGKTCSRDQYELADENILKYLPDGRGTIQMRRWLRGGAPSCANVRDEPF